MEETQTLLLAELDHRIKNTLAIAQSITRQTLRSVNDPKLAAELVSARLQALSQTHDLLRDAQWREASLLEVVRVALAGPGVEPARIRAAGPALTLSAAQSLSLTLMLHELMTNALKHGALSQEGGHVALDWQLQGSPKQELVFEWREKDGPPATTPLEQGFGSHLIRRAWESDFGGTVLMDYQPGGLAGTFRAPWPVRQG
jgi:two-component sensor histidine kinase